MSIWNALFGWPGAWGTGGNLVAWIICGAIAGLWLRAKLKAHQALARLHHQEKLDQAERHHQEAMKQAGTQHAIILKHISDHAGSKARGRP